MKPGPDSVRRVREVRIVTHSSHTQWKDHGHADPHSRFEGEVIERGWDMPRHLMLSRKRRRPALLRGVS